MLSYFGDARPGLFRRKQREPCHHLERPATAGPAEQDGAWGTDNGEPQRGDPSMEAAANLQGQEGCDASEVDHRWASPRTTKAHTVVVSLTCFFTSSLFFSAIGHGI